MKNTYLFIDRNLDLVLWREEFDDSNLTNDEFHLKLNSIIDKIVKDKKGDVA